MGVTTHTRNIVTIGVNTGVDSAASVCVVALVIALGIFEIQRRATLSVASWSPWSVVRSIRSTNWKRVLIQCAPEVLGTLGCFGLVAALLSRPREFETAEDQEMWDQIQADWPRLVCADTLLAIQAMLRLVVLAAAVYHGCAAGPVPLAPQAATLLGLGCLARASVSAGSSAYLMDGPCGSTLPVACDAVSTLLAFYLGRACLRKRLLPTVFTSIALTVLASRHCLNLSGGKPHFDALFVASYGFDSLAAFTHLFQTLSVGSAAAAVPRQAILAVQAMLGTYYFHYALPHTAEIVLAGKPLQFLELAHTAAAAACLGAMALYVVDEAPLASSGDFVAKADDEPIRVLAGSGRPLGAVGISASPGFVAAGARADAPTGIVLW